jgi:hypothetical protein
MAKVNALHSLYLLAHICGSHKNIFAHWINLQTFCLNAAIIVYIATQQAVFFAIKFLLFVK